jgi:carbamoyltransferase
MACTSEIKTAAGTNAVHILGINYIFHDSSACVVSGGELVAAIEEERLTRRKHTHEFPYRAIGACLKQAHLTADDVDHVAVSVEPEKMNTEKLAYAAGLNGRAATFMAYEFGRLQERHILFWSWVQKTWPDENRRPRIHFVDHHTAHVVGSYYVSPWRKAALLSVDGWGEWTSTWLGFAGGTQVTQLNESVFPHSLGLFYSAATEFCGFVPNYDEGKTMGLAPTGDPKRFYGEVRDMVDVSSEGRVTLDMSWFDYDALGGRLCGDRFSSRFGLPRERKAPLEQHHRDIAAAFQRVVEESAIALCGVLERATDAEYLVLAGGVAMNSVMNGRLLRETRFRDVYVMPGAGDNGTCIGAAYQVFNGVLARPKHYRHVDPFLGTEYSDGEIRSTIAACKLSYRHASDICREVAELLRAGSIVGWFQGRMEFGARALGNRSILANPAIPGMKDRINLQVKHREAFRPFAPSVPLEYCAEYFDIHVDSPFMLKVCPVRESARDAVGAAVHVDGSARVQTVSRDVNPRYHELLIQFGELTGHPVLLNTSFNIMDEPMVESPLDAIRCFFSTGLDQLVIGDYIISK